MNRRGGVTPSLDLRDEVGPDGQPLNVAPNSIEAEQALLGCLLFDAAAVFDTLPPGLTPGHFFEPIHGRIFASIASDVRKGRTVDPIILAEEFRRDAAFKEMGGLSYLGQLIDKSPPAPGAPGFADAIMDTALRRSIIQIGEEMARRARLEWRNDDDDQRVGGVDILNTAQAAIMSATVTSVRDELVDLESAIDGVIAYVQDRSSPPGVVSGVPPIDLALGSMQPGDLILLAGRPSMGKSAVSVAIELGVAAPVLTADMNGLLDDMRIRAGIDTRGRGVITIQGEMTFGKPGEGGQVARRHLSDVGFHLYGDAFPTYQALRDKRVTPEQVDMLIRARGEFAGVPIRGIKKTGCRVSELRTICRRQIATWARQGIECGLIVIDHVGLLRADGRASGRYEAQTEIAIALKELAGELNVPILALVQLSRQIENRDDKRPQLSDLRDSGAWEENADTVAFVYRDAYYAQRSKEPDADRDPGAWNDWDKRRRSPEIEIIIGKLREGDPGKVAKVWGHLSHNVIRGVEPERKGVLI